MIPHCAGCIEITLHRLTHLEQQANYGANPFWGGLLLGRGTQKKGVGVDCQRKLWGVPWQFHTTSGECPIPICPTIRAGSRAFFYVISLYFEIVDIVQFSLDNRNSDGTRDEYTATQIHQVQRQDCTHIF